MSEVIVTPSPTRSRDLFIRRLVVTGELGLDLSFERGLNVIESRASRSGPRASNRAGKTALVELIRFGLGRRIKSAKKFHFVGIQDQLDRLYLEVELGDDVYVVERPLRQVFAAARVRRGAYSEEMIRSEGSVVHVNELSAWYLSRLGIPDVSMKTSKGGLMPLSFPTLMRAFVLHQEDSFGAILDKVDPDQMKVEVISFLTGIATERRYEVEIEVAQAQTAFEAKSAQMKAVGEFLREIGVPTLPEAEALLEQRGAALESAVRAEALVQKSVRNAGAKGDETKGVIEGVRSRLLELKEDRATAESLLVGRQGERERLTELLASLQQDLRRIERLRSSTALLSTVAFSSCPRCLQELTPEMEAREDHGDCALCARPLGMTSDEVPVQAPKPDDVEAQVVELEQVLTGVNAEIHAAAARLKQIADEESALAAELDRAMQQFVSPSVDRLIEAGRLVAERRRELSEIERVYEQALAFGRLLQETERLEATLRDLEAERRAAAKPNAARLALLTQELDRVLRGVGYPKYNGCTIDRSSLMPSVNGTHYESQGAAYKGLIATSYYLAMWLLAQEAPAYMPRMLVVDSPSTGDLNDESYDRLLSFLGSLQSDDTDRDDLGWQLILTTRQVVESLERHVVLSISGEEGQMLLRPTS